MVYFNRNDSLLMSQFDITDIRNEWSDMISDNFRIIKYRHELVIAYRQVLQNSLLSLTSPTNGRKTSCKQVVLAACHNQVSQGRFRICNFFQADTRSLIHLIAKRIKFHDHFSENVIYFCALRINFKMAFYICIVCLSSVWQSILL